MYLCSLCPVLELNINLICCAFQITFKEVTRTEWSNAVQQSEMQTETIFFGSADCTTALPLPWISPLTITLGLCFGNSA